MSQININYHLPHDLIIVRIFILYLEHSNNRKNMPTGI